MRIWERLRTLTADEVQVRGRMEVPQFTVATAPSNPPAGALIYVSDETGGAVLAFGDGTNWRRVTDRAVIA